MKICGSESSMMFTLARVAVMKCPLVTAVENVVMERGNGKKLINCFVVGIARHVVRTRYLMRQFANHVDKIA